MEIKSPEKDENVTDWYDKKKFKKYQLFLTVTSLITKIKQVNSGIMTLKTWLILLTTIQLVRYLLEII